MSWTTLGAKLDVRYLRAAVAREVGNARQTISIGRSFNVAGFSSSTPIEVVDGSDPPKLEGSPYLKTNFRRGSFSKTLYTPSTLRCVVGRDWNPSWYNLFKKVEQRAE